ncbi:probable sucrose-phosphate synthase 1 isoform X2 [Punica granatum]|uniref:Sucrose-phosphate synthase n=1 Tax=Punica granatum TaxID=22663 RepID=A0A6P8C649_PUNGR|nr:probable sucrose-phosphate synthase 1 isoform X2 [Punica granatum]
MAGNDWVNSYLEAILDVDRSLGDGKSSLLLRERGRFSPTRYFVEEVITGFDETDLHRSWIRAAATRSPQERNTRLENLCWRIWNLARKKKQLEGEESRRSAQRQREHEKGRREATADMSEDTSEGEKGDMFLDVSTHSSSTDARMHRNSSMGIVEDWSSQYKEHKLYIVLISLHGLIRGENMELGRDSDTGGQVKYVVELARALGAMLGVYRVDLLTRQVSAPDVDWSYGEPTEMLNTGKNECSMQEHGESCGAYIIRIPFGPKDKYIPKELLWPHIPEFVDGALCHIIQMSKVLGKQIGGGQPVWPIAVHGHYADAGDAAALISGVLNVPMLFTGHSLGRDKLEQLLKQGRMSRDEINTTYKIMRRIEAEELCLDVSEIVITSTKQEIEEQWRLYNGFDLVLERKLRARIRRGVSCHGRYMPRMVVIPPGMEFHHIAGHDSDGELERSQDNHQNPPIWSEIMRFFSNPCKPMILALARPDPKKNLTMLVKAFGECRPLQELANLTLIMGNRDDIDEMSGTSAAVLLSILKLIDKYDLYGQVAYPKHHKQSDVPEIYRLAAKTKAAAHGLPIVATKNGGPVDIHRVLDNGLLVDPHDQQSIANALLKLVSDKQLWLRCRQNGLKNIHRFSWPEHCKTYLSRIISCKPRQPQWKRSGDKVENSEAFSPSESLRDIQDLSLSPKLSLDGEKIDGGGPLDTLGPEEKAATGKSNVENAVLTLSKGILGVSEKHVHSVSTSEFPKFKRKKRVFVVAVDCCSVSETLEVIRNVMKSGGKDSKDSAVGFILSMALKISEIQSLLSSGGMSISDFDAFIYNSGGALCYPSEGSEDGLPGLPVVVDMDYQGHIEYRWGGESLRKTLFRWAASVNDKSEGKILVAEDDSTSAPHCISFTVNDPEHIPSVKELRKLMRTQALRCHVMYCQSGSRLNVIPVLASRFQALRYLRVRWGVDLANFVVFVGENGDTDYEGLIGGAHKTVILKGVGSRSTKFQSGRSYPLEHVVPFDSPNVAQSKGSDVESIVEALATVGLDKS